jgi:hypothetical protein
VDPDPISSETFSRTQGTDPEKIIPDPGSPVSEMNLKGYFSEKLKKFDHFSTKMPNLKIQIPFCQ